MSERMVGPGGVWTGDQLLAHRRYEMPHGAYARSSTYVDGARLNVRYDSLPSAASVFRSSLTQLGRNGYTIPARSNPLGSIR